MPNTENSSILFNVEVVDNFVEAKQKSENAKKEYEQLQSSLKNLDAQYAKLTKSQKQNTSEGQQLAASIGNTKAAIANQVKAMAQADSQYKKAEKALQSMADIENLFAQISDGASMSLNQMKQELANLSNISLDSLSPEQLEAFSNAVTYLNEKIAECESQLQSMTPGAFWANANESVQVLGTTVQGLTAIFGENNQTINALSGAVQKFSSVTRAAAAVSDFFTKKKHLAIAANIKQTLTTMQATAATKAQAAQQRGATAATVAWNVAQKVLNATMKAFPLFAIIGGITALIGGITALVGWLSSASSKSEEFNSAMQKVDESAARKKIDDVIQSVDDYVKSIENANKTEEELLKEEIAAAKQSAKTTSDKFKTKATESDNLIAKLQKEKDALDKLMKSEDTDFLTKAKSIDRYKELGKDIDALTQKRNGDIMAMEHWAKVAEGTQGKIIPLIDPSTGKFWEIKGTSLNEQEEKVDAAAEQQKEQEAQKNRAKELEQEEKLALAKLEQEKNFQEDDFAAKQAYEKEVFDTQQAYAKKRLQAQLANKQITLNEYSNELKLLEAQRTQFENKQQQDQDKHNQQLQKQLKKHQKEMLKMMGEEVKLQKMEVTEEYENMIKDIETTMKMLPKDSPEYKQLAENIKTIREQLNKELETIDKDAAQTKLQNTLDALDEEHEKTMEKLASNKLEELELERQHLIDKQMAKLAADPNADISEETAALIANEQATQLALIHAGAAEQLAAENLTAKKRYQIKRDAAQKELDLLREQGKEGTAEFAAKEQEIADLDAEFKEQRFERIMEFAEKSKEVMNGIFELTNAQDEAKLQKATEQNEYEKQQLQQQLDANLISKEEYNKKVKQSDDKLAKEQAKIKRKKAIQDKANAIFEATINTALAIASALKTDPFLPMGPIMAGVAGAMGAIQIATILAQPLPKAARGMFIKGASHAMGGVQLEAEGGEMVINKRSSSMFAPLLSAINEAGGGVPFVSSYSDGGFAMRDYQRTATQGITSESIASAVKEAVQEVKIYTAIEDINDGNKKYTAVTDSSKY